MYHQRLTLIMGISRVIYVLSYLQYFKGRFYEQKRFWTVFEIGAKCVHADYTVKDDGHVEVKNSGFNAT